MGVTELLILGLRALISMISNETPAKNCDDPLQGYQCTPEISHIWGQYSPYFKVPSAIPPAVPATCKVTFAQVLSRHGARYPTEHRGLSYQRTVKKIHDNVQNYSSDYAFIKDFKYTFGSDDLTLFGQQEMVNSGIDFFTRYSDLSRHEIPFVRASGQQRVIDSAKEWIKGFHQARSVDSPVDAAHLYPDVVIPEGRNVSNPLDHGLCDSFEDGPSSHISASSQAQWAAIFVPSIRDRVNANLQGADLNVTDTMDLMDLCPYDTVASPSGTISPFCDLFDKTEWSYYDYYQSLGKYYGHGSGNPLGPTQGVGFVNELIARLTNTSVVDHTSTNHTLDSDPSTFPRGRTLYADFGHDSGLISVFFAMNLYASTADLLNTTYQDIRETGGYSAALAVPFAGRAYIEKLQCEDSPTEEMVRVIVNGRVNSLDACGGDASGRCPLSKFIDSLSFAAQGGHWDQCLD